MHRVQIQLTGEQAERLRERARQRRLSTAAVVREAVGAELRDPGGDQRPGPLPALPLVTIFVDTSALYPLMDGDDPDHDRAAVSAVLTARLRQLSVVDAVSFEVMRRAGVRAAFAFDDRFARFGFDLLPNQALV